MHFSHFNAHFIDDAFLGWSLILCYSIAFFYFCFIWMPNFLSNSNGAQLLSDLVLHRKQTYPLNKLQKKYSKCVFAFNKVNDHRHSF